MNWYRKAAEQGFAEAQYNLGVCYNNGHGITQDYKQAVRWYRKAAEQGHARAQHNLGASYVNGEGVLEDYVQAYKWFNIASTNGLEEGTLNRNLVAQYMTTSQITDANNLSKEWIEKHQ